MQHAQTNEPQMLNCFRGWAAGPCLRTVPGTGAARELCMGTVSMAFTLSMASDRSTSPRLAALHSYDTGQQMLTCCRGWTAGGPLETAPLATAAWAPCTGTCPGGLVPWNCPSRQQRGPRSSGWLLGCLRSPARTSCGSADGWHGQAGYIEQGRAQQRFSQRSSLPRAAQAGGRPAHLLQQDVSVRQPLQPRLMQLSALSPGVHQLQARRTVGTRRLGRRRATQSRSSGKLLCSE